MYLYKFLKSNQQLIFLISYLIIGYIPRLGAVDNIAPQWLILSILNGTCLVYLLVTNNHKNLLNPFKGVTSKSLLIFLLFCLISLTYSININETIINISRVFNVVVMFFNCIILLSQIKNTFLIISILLTIGLGYEIYRSLLGYFDLISMTNYNFSYSYLLQGVTGNKNVTSASIAIKLPFVVYLFYEIKNKFFKSLFVFIIFITFFNLILLGSRAIYVSISIYIFSYVILILIKFRGKKFLKHLAVPVIPLIVAILFSFVSLQRNNTANVFSRIQTIDLNEESTSQRIRFYGHALDYIFNNPIRGLGLGNWKIKSIEYDSKNMRNYIVPYHVHNDLLEIGTEIGLIGLLFYVIFLFSPFINTILQILKHEGESTVNFGIALIGAFIVYLVDANLNFPNARVIMQLSLVLVATTSLFYTKKFQLNED